MESALVRSSSRMEAYSDAIFSVAATVMILPISHTHIPEKEDLFENIVDKLIPQIGVYVFTFAIVCQSWNHHIWLFDTIELVDEFIVLLNLAYMMIITFLPFSFTLLGRFMSNYISIVIFSSALIILGLLQVVMIIHAFYNPELLKFEVQNSPLLKSYRNRMLSQAITPVLLALAALLVALINPIAGVATLLLILVSHYIRAIFLKIFGRFCNSDVSDEQLLITQESPIHLRLMNETVEKERIEFFSDGVFAIVSTIIIIDICEDDIPSAEQVKHLGGLIAALHVYSKTYFAYAGTFATVALLWFCHHSLLHYIKEPSKLGVFFNNLCLMCVGLSPLTFKLFTNFQQHKFHSNESVAIRFNCVAIFLAGVFQLFFWVASLYKQNHFVLEVAHFDSRKHLYITAKLCLFPLATLFLYFMSLFAGNVETISFIVSQIGIVGGFIFLSILYSVCKRKAENSTRRESLRSELMDSVHFSTDERPQPERETL